MPLLCIKDEFCKLGVASMIRQEHFNSYNSHAFTEAYEGNGSLDHIPKNFKPRPPRCYYKTENDISIL